MKSKLNRRRGFTIAEIIVAVAIMATLVAVMMKGLQASRANIKRDTYQTEVNKRAINIGAKAEAYVFKNGNTNNFKNTLDSNDETDPAGETYTITVTDRTSTQPYKVTVTPKTDGVLDTLKVGAYTYEFE